MVRKRAGRWIEDLGDEGKWAGKVRIMMRCAAACLSQLEFGDKWNPWMLRKH